MKKVTIDSPKSVDNPNLFRKRKQRRKNERKNHQARILTRVRIQSLTDGVKRIAESGKEKSQVHRRAPVRLKICQVLPRAIRLITPVMIRRIQLSFKNQVSSIYLNFRLKFNRLFSIELKLRI